MQHHESNTGTEHVIACESLGMMVTACGETVVGAADIDTPATAARVADNLCENCRKAADDETLNALYEKADETCAAKA